ncbi:RNA-DNA hybrid ribonuclease [Aureococcus anophagefferens]|nr:RNA-DNA hybrid ribonuclease [Aureococcus anophagefferens]
MDAETITPVTTSTVQVPIDGLLESRTTPPSVRRGEAVKLGIDEAGRGPVLGAMTFGTCYWSIADDDAIEASQKEIDDSKQLTDEKRSKLFDRIAADERMGWAAEVGSRRRISAEMLQVKPTSLNAISFDATCRLIQRVLDRGADVVKASAARPAPRRFSRFGAENNETSLPSCLVCRDLSIARWTYDEPGVDDLDFGSGYPSDPACARLRDTDTQPDDLKAQFGAVVKVDFDAKDEDDAAANSMKITDCATVSKKKQTGPAKKKRKRAHFYRSLESLTELAEVC